MPVYRQQLIEAKNAYRARDYARHMKSTLNYTPRCPLTIQPGTPMPGQYTNYHQGAIIGGCRAHNRTDPAEQSQLH